MEQEEYSKMIIKALKKVHMEKRNGTKPHLLKELKRDLTLGDIMYNDDFVTFTDTYVIGYDKKGIVLEYSDILWAYIDGKKEETDTSTADHGLVIHYDDTCMKLGHFSREEVVEEILHGMKNQNKDLLIGDTTDNQSKYEAIMNSRKKERAV